MLLISSVRVMLETWGTFDITQWLFLARYHPLPVFREHRLSSATGYRHPITLLTRLPVDLGSREVLRSVNHHLMCPSEHICWRRKTFSYASDERGIRFLIATLVVDLVLLKLQLLLGVILRG